MQHGSRQQTESPLLEAARKGDVAEVRGLLARGADPNARELLSGYTALHFAAVGGHLDVVRLLVESGARVDDRQNTVFESPLAGAVVAGRADVVAYLLARGADPCERLYGDDHSLLEEAEHYGAVTVAELLRQAIEGRRFQ
jgi:ankyrin repeat protein